MSPASRQCSRVFLLIAVLGFAARSAELPTPLVSFSFGAHLRNAGSLGGEGVIEEYAPGEGPGFGPGVHGMGLCQRRPSRAGGPGTTPAGGAVVYEDTGLAALQAVTVTLWFRPDGTNRIARLVYSSNQWDLYVSGGHIGFNFRHRGEDQHRHAPADEPCVRDHAWNAVAVTHDRASGVAALYHGTLDEPLERIAEWTDLPPPDPGQGTLQIGNLEQIRPFRGCVDSVRIYGQALSHDQLRQLVSKEGGQRMYLDHLAAPMPEHSNDLKHGDVLLSSRSRRKNSLDTIRAFKPNRLMWCYSTDAEFVRACRDAGIQTYQAAINSIAGPSEPEAQAVDLDGHPVVAPWMVSFNREKPWYWGCNNRPRFLELSVERATRALEAGADWIQFDDWAMVVSAHNWAGACFCDHCMEAFALYLHQHLDRAQLADAGIDSLDGFDYRTYLRDYHGINSARKYRDQRDAVTTTAWFGDFQRDSVRTFFDNLRTRLNAAAGRRVPLSINSTFYRPSSHTNYAVDIVDFLQGETWHMDLVDLAIPAKCAESLGTWQVFVPKPRDLRVARRGIAASYALGQLMLVPWDMYMGSDATGIRPRYYGTPEEYGDLFEFVRKKRRLLDHHETAAWASVVVDLDHLDMNRLGHVCRKLLQAQMPFTFAPVAVEHYRAGLDRKRLETKHLIITACNPQTLPDDDRRLLEDLPERVPVIADRNLREEDLEALSPLAVWGPPDVVAIPRTNPQNERENMTLHLLNRTRLDSVNWTSVVVRTHALKQTVENARWHAPGQNGEPQHLDIEQHSDGTRILVPTLAEWGIIELNPITE